MEVNCHKLVANLCVEMANECYDEILTRSNVLNSRRPTRASFVKEVAPTLREEARRILASMLERHDVSTAEKNEIYEALLLDNSLPRSGVWSAPQSIH